MFLYVCKQTFRKLWGYVTRKFLGLRMRIFEGIIFIWTRTYRERFSNLHLCTFKACIGCWLKAKDKLEASGRCTIKQLFLKFLKLPKIWLQQCLFTFTTPFVKGFHYNSFWIIIFDIQRSYFREYFLSCFSTEAVAQRCSVKKMLLQIFQNSQENTCTRVSLKKETLA